MDIQYVYTKKRSEFGRQVHFADRPAEIIADIQPNPELVRDYVARNPVEIGIQNVREFSEHWVGSRREMMCRGGGERRSVCSSGEHRPIRNGTSRSQSCRRWVATRYQLTGTGSNLAFSKENGKRRRLWTIDAVSRTGRSIIIRWSPEIRTSLLLVN